MMGGSWQGDVATATARVRVGLEAYATLSVTCRTRGTETHDAESLADLRREGLHSLTTYAVAVARALNDAGMPPTRIDVLSEGLAKRTAGQMGLASMAVEVRALVPGGDPATFDALVRSPDCMRYIHHGLLLGVEVAIVSKLVSGETMEVPLTSDDNPPAALKPRRLRRLAAMLMLVVVLFGSGLAVVLTQGPIGVEGPFTPKSTTTEAQSPVLAAAAPTATVDVQPAAAAPAPATVSTGGEATATDAPVAPLATPPPEPTRPQATPTASARATATSAPTAAAPALTVFDENFATNARRWPDNAQSTARLAPGGYELQPRTAGQFVAVRAPLPAAVRDVRVTGVFHKLGGPAGGGYGLIVRDQSVPLLEGTNQTGRFYVCEVSDRGEVGVWRRDNAVWVDLQPWKPSDAVQPAEGTNELTVETRGPRLSFIVNGANVAEVEDATLPDGGVGVFAGGDGNIALLERLTIEPLT